MQSLPSPAGRTIPEDTLHYVIHLPATAAPESLATLITTYVDSLLPPGWIWHKDSWQLVVLPEGDVQDRRKRFGEVVGKVLEGQDEESGDLDGKGSSLGGTMRIGEAIDDEWLVVWLLKQVSLKWPDLVISYVPSSLKIIRPRLTACRIRDTDGEFLLIEAAEHLPRWLTPDNAENRVSSSFPPDRWKLMLVIVLARKRTLSPYSANL